MSTSNRTVTAFETALQEFLAESRLKPVDHRRFQNTTYDQVRTQIDGIQAKLMRQRRGQNLTRLKSFLEAIDQFGKVVEVFGNASLLVAFVWGPMKFLLQVASAWTDALDDLVSLYEKIGDSFPQYLQLERLFHADSDMLKYLVLIYKDILRFHQRALRYFQQPLLQQLFQATWKTYKTRFNPIVDDIERHGMQLQTQTIISRVRDEAQQLRAIITEQLAHRLRDIYTWLRSPTNGAASSIENDHFYYRNICRDYPESNKWVLLKETFIKSGAGKTILSSFVIEEIKRSYLQSTVLFFYCKQDNTDRSTFACLGRHFLAESLKYNHDLLLTVFHDKFSKSTEPVLTNMKDIEELLRIAILDCPSVYIVIDGIDECPRDERKHITVWFRELIEGLDPRDQDRIRCLFVSQDDGVARKDFSGLENLKIEPADNKKDIEHFSKAEASQIQSEFQLDTELTAKIASKIQDAAGGMFLLARLIASNLMQQTSIEEIEMELEEDRLPKELGDAYSRILSRVFSQSSDQQKAATQTLLQWLICAKRTLKWHEIQSAKSIDVPNQVVDWERRRFRVNSKDLCGSLVEVRDDDTVDLIHNTAKLFLRSGRNISVDLRAANLSLAALYVDYLNMPGFRQNLQVDKAFVVSGYYGFMDYAVACWIRHVEEGKSGEEDTLSDPEFNNFAESLETFLDIHAKPWDSSTKPPSVSKGNERRMKTFEKYSFFPRLQRAVILLRKELTHFGPMKESEVALDLTDIVGHIQAAIEEVYTVSTASHQLNDLVKMYGSKIFKCPRLSCRYFYDGFLTASERDQHLNKHLRPFRCTVLGCPLSSLGLESSEKLSKHVENTHNIPKDDAAAFPDMSEFVEDIPHKRHGSPTGRHRNKKSKKDPRPKVTEWKCPHCQKVFKKKHNYTSHLVIHSDRRDFICGTCGASFARENDCKRHEMNHKARQFVCGGELSNGRRWGCGNKYARLDTLQEHHRSATGRACLASRSQEQSNSTGDIASQQTEASHLVEDPWGLGRDFFGS